MDGKVSKREVLRGELVGFDQQPWVSTWGKRQMDKTTQAGIIEAHESDVASVVAIHRESNRAMWIQARAETIDVVAERLIDDLANRSQAIRHYVDRCDPLTAELMLEVHRVAFESSKRLLKEAGE